MHDEVLWCSCGRKIHTRPEWAGHRVRCPNCGNALDVPAAGVPVTTTKACPFCAETIQADAVKCRFCNEMLTGVPPQPRPRTAPAYAPPPPPPRDATGGTGVFIVALLGWILCGILHPIAWIMGSNYETDCRSRGIQPSGLGVAGKILGMVGTIFMIIGCGLGGAIAMSGGFR